MNIIIAGAGNVGYRLAKTLSFKHNVTVIDKNADALGVLLESIDVLSITGDIEDPDTYRSLLNRSFDIFIAVTDSDEANILSTLIADDAIDAKKKIIRLKNEYFAKSSITQKLGVSDAVFPFVETARSVRSLLDFPKANNVKEFIYTDFKLISVFVQNSELEGEEISRLNGEGSVVVGLERNKEFWIPEENERLQQHDLLYFFGDAEHIRELCSKIDTKMPKKINKIAIFGAGLLGVEIAKLLLERDIQLKVIERDATLCKRASEQLQDRASIINSRYVEHTIFDEEQIRHSDMVISTDTEDEENIIRCLEAKERGVEKTVAINNATEHYELMHKLGIVASRGPKTNAYYAILEKIGSSAVISEKHYCGGRAAVFTRKIFENSPLIGKKIRPFQNRGIRSYIVKRGEILPFTEKRELEMDDVIFVFLRATEEEKVKQWIYSL
ncbi:MAG: potassium transporter [Campylobacteraceae bacterium 4484_4]|nr:MAG: potassium transporter [Campylobacteraceae bacterium 4484_4]